MNLLCHTKNKEINKREISLTAYRAYFIFELLLKTPLSKDEILSIVKSNQILSAVSHKDSIVNSINTLRAAGCEIEKPKASNNFKYSLISHPFKIDITENQADIMNFLRKSLYAQADYNLIFEINDVYEIIKNLLSQSKFIEIIENSNYFRNVDVKILSQLLNFCKEKSIIVIVYNSPVNDTEEIQIKCEKVFFENKRLYLWGWSYKYNHCSYHRIDKIKAIKFIRKSESSDPVVHTVKARYELVGDAIKMFVPTPDETIINYNQESLIIENNVINKFNFFQRVASFGGDCKILSPQDLRTDFVEALNKVLKVYEEDVK